MPAEKGTRRPQRERRCLPQTGATETPSSAMFTGGERESRTFARVASSAALTIQPYQAQQRRVAKHEASAVSHSWRAVAAAARTIPAQSEQKLFFVG